MHTAVVASPSCGEGAENDDNGASAEMDEGGFLRLSPSAEAQYSVLQNEVTLHKYMQNSVWSSALQNELISRNYM
jgi:hypothetical protein